MRDGVAGESAKRVLMAKTGLDGHWRGPTLVATALRDAGFEVIMIGMVQAGELVQAAIDEDVDLVGLNVSGHVDVALRAVKQIQDACSGVPVFAGGVVPPRVFIRSMAARGHRGGLARATQCARRLLQHCGWPVVLVETLGVGQAELDVVDLADLTVVVLNPGWGDEIQASKAGLMEIADLFVINKAERPGLAATRRDLDALIAQRPPQRRPAVVETVACEGRGIAQLAGRIAETRERLQAQGRLPGRRAAVTDG